MKNLTVLKAGIDEGYEVRQEGEHLVVPVVMMVEGVHHGNLGPLLYPAEELSTNFGQWEGTPVVINHPETENGVALSANDPSLPEGTIIGQVRNPFMEDTRLRAEVWLDKEKTMSADIDMYNSILASSPMDVSIGVSAQNEQSTGTWHNEEYIGIARNYTPDHLALLPEARGACSFDDGCGLRNKDNQSSIKNKMNEKKKELVENEVRLSLGEESTLLLNSEELFNNEIGYREIGQQLQSQLDAMDTATTYNFLEEVFEGSFIYRVRNTETNSSDFYKRSFQVENEAVTVGEEAERVQRKVTFEVIENKSTMKRTNVNKSNVKLKRKKVMNENSSPCKVSAVINHKGTNFTEDDREWLSTLEESVLNKMIPAEEEKPEATPVQNAEVTEEQIKKILSKDGDPFAFIDNFMPEGLKDQMKNGVSMYQEKRKTLTDQIVANSEFVEENLKSWKIEDLEKLHNSVVKSDYSLNAASEETETSSIEEDEEAQAMLNVNVKPKNDE
jgi:hypothetical protein